MTYVRSDEDEVDAVERVLARVENYPFEIDLLFADSGFYNERIPAALVISPQRSFTPKKGERMKDKLETHKSYMTTYRTYKDSERELRCACPRSLSPTRTEIEASARRGRSWLRGVWRYYRSAKQVEHRYRKRSGIETTYRLLRQAR